MKIAACVFADFVEAPLGGPAALTVPLRGAPVLQHTLRRVAQVPDLEWRLLVVQPRDLAAGRAALEQAGLATTFQLMPLGSEFQTHRRLMQAGRKWNPWAWRGSPLGSTWFDEFVDVAAVARVMNQLGCESVLCLDGHQAALDVKLAEQMAQAVRQNPAEVSICFTQAPPGLAGILLQRGAVRELMEHNLPVGMLLSYRPELPRLDPITRPGCVRIDARIARVNARLSGDTRRGRELLEGAFEESGPDCNARQICDWIANRTEDDPVFLCGEVPREIELEITTDYPLTNSQFRPPALPAKRLDDLETIERIATELAQYDDRLVVLSGCGDPLLHPALSDITRRLRRGGVFGLAIVTPLIELSDATLDVLLSTPVDLVQVTLDAHSPQTYARVHGEDRFAQVSANIERLRAARQARKSPEPLILPSIRRCSATLGEIDEFFDHWIRKTDWAVIEGFNDYCGALPADPLLTTEPLRRDPCRRLGSRLFLASDGNVPQCGQDFAGTTSIGNWRAQSLSQIWKGANLSKLRSAHAAKQWKSLPLCGQCGEWMRP